VNVVSKIIYLGGSASLVIARNPSMYSTKNAGDVAVDNESGFSKRSGTRVVYMHVFSDATLYNKGSLRI
jgi:hypothetical protein